MSKWSDSSLFTNTRVPLSAAVKLETMTRVSIAHYQNASNEGATRSKSRVHGPRTRFQARGCHFWPNLVRRQEISAQTARNPQSRQAVILQGVAFVLVLSTTPVSFVADSRPHEALLHHVYDSKNTYLTSTVAIPGGDLGRMSEGNGIWCTVVE